MPFYNHLTAAAVHIVQLSHHSTKSLKIMLSFMNKELRRGPLLVTCSESKQLGSVLMHAVCAAAALGRQTADHGVIYDTDRWLRGAG